MTFSEYEKQELLALLAEMRVRFQLLEQDRVAAEILTHVDPRPRAGPQFIGGFLDGEFVADKLPASLQKEWRVQMLALQRFEAQAWADDSWLDIGPPPTAEYRRGRDGNWYWVS